MHMLEAADLVGLLHHLELWGVGFWTVTTALTKLLRKQRGFVYSVDGFDRFQRLFRQHLVLSTGCVERMRVWES